jgi:hypothetical protein
MLHQFYTLEKYDITKKEIIKALNDKYKSSAKTEDKEEKRRNFFINKASILI